MKYEYWRFPERLAEKRHELGLSQLSLCADADLPNNSVYLYESGTYPQVKSLVKLAEALDVSVDYLLGRTE